MGGMGEMAKGVALARNKRLGRQYPYLARVRILCELIGGAIWTAWRGRGVGVLLVETDCEEASVALVAGLEEVGSRSEVDAVAGLALARSKEGSVSAAVGAESREDCARVGLVGDRALAEADPPGVSEPAGRGPRGGVGGGVGWAARLDWWRCG